MSNEPITRKEMFMAKASGQNVNMPKPITREEKFLERIAENGGKATSWKDLGEKTVMGDTLTWDGNTEGLYCPDEIFYHVSDAVPTMEELQQGVLVEDDGTVKSIDYEKLAKMSESVIIYMDNTTPFLVALVDDATVYGNDGILRLYEKAGVYIAYLDDAPFITKLTINGFKGFPTTEITPIDPKYIDDMYYEIPAVWDKVELINDTWNGRATCKLASNSVEWAENNSYRLRIDEVEYAFNGMKMFQATPVVDAKNVYYIGATYLPNNTAMNFTEYPFCLLTTDFENIYVVFGDGSIKHTVEVLKSDAVIHHIPEKYLPNTVVRSVNGKKTNENGNVDILIRFTTLGYINQIADQYDEIGNAELVLIKDTSVQNSTGVDFDSKPLLIALLNISRGIREFYALGFNGKRYRGEINLSNYTLSISELTS